jgi:Uma2 family endonuclease
MNRAALKSRIPNYYHHYDAPGLFRVPKEAHVLAGFRQWVLADDFPEKLRVTFLHGDVYLEVGDMGKEEIRTHAAVKTEMARVLTTLNAEDDYGDFYINGVLVTNEEADVANNPDMVAVFWESLEKGLCKYASRGERDSEIVGSPDWLLEIVSDSSVIKDTQNLRRAYHQARVREYWIVDARKEDIVFQILTWRESGFVSVRPKDSWLRSPVFGRHFRLTRKCDRRGGWKYTLDVK